MKRLVCLLLIGTFIPQLASAAWWNPASWGVFNKVDTRTQVLEKKVKDLERKLEEASSQASTSTSKINNEGFIKTDRTSEVKQDNPIKFPPLQNQTPVVNQQNDNVIFDDLIQKYSQLRTQIEEAINFTRRNSPLESERNYYKFLEKYLISVNADLGYLSQIKSLNPRPKVNDLYSQKFLKLNSEYRTQKKSYGAAIEDESLEYEAQAPQRRRLSEEKTRKNSLECKVATSAYEAIKTEAKPFRDKESGWYNEYLLTGKYNNSSERSTNTLKLADLAVRESGLMSKYYLACEGFVPEPPKTYNTNCYYTGSSMHCNTY